MAVVMKTILRACRAGLLGNIPESVDGVGAVIE